MSVVHLLNCKQILVLQFKCQEPFRPRVKLCLISTRPAGAGQSGLSLALLLNCLNIYNEVPSCLDAARQQARPRARPYQGLQRLDCNSQLDAWHAISRRAGQSRCCNSQPLNTIFWVCLQLRTLFALPSLLVHVCDPTVMLPSSVYRSCASCDAARVVVNNRCTQVCEPWFVI